MADPEVPPTEPPPAAEATPGDPVGYTELDDTYAKIAEQSALPPGHSADGQPADPAMPTTNAYEGGGLPLYPKEPYPTGNPPEGRTVAQIHQGVK